MPAGSIAAAEPMHSGSGCRAPPAAAIPPSAGAGRVEHRGAGRFGLPDGTERYLVDEAGLMKWTRELGGQLLDPLKTTLVQDQRSMTTWVVRKD